MKKDRKWFALFLNGNDTNIRKNPYITDTVYYEMNLHFCVIEPNSQIRNGLDTFVYGLQVRTSWRKGEPPYRGHVVYVDNLGGGEVHLDRARVMHTTLAKIQRYHQRTQMRTVTFGEYVTMVCNALGINEVVVRTKGDSLTYSENQYEICDINEVYIGGTRCHALNVAPLAQVIDNEIAAHQRKEQEEVA